MKDICYHEGTVVHHPINIKNKQYDEWAECTKCGDKSWFATVGRPIIDLEA